MPVFSKAKLIGINNPDISSQKTSLQKLARKEIEICCKEGTRRGSVCQKEGHRTAWSCPFKKNNCVANIIFYSEVLTK